MPDRSSYVRTSDGTLQKIQNPDNSYPGLPSNQVSPAEGWIPDSSENSHTTETRNWIELTSPEDDFPSRGHDTTKTVNDDEEFPFNDQRANALDSGSIPEQSLEDSFFQQDFFSDDRSSYEAEPSLNPLAQTLQPSQVFSTQQWDNTIGSTSTATYPLTAAEKEALYKIAMPNGPLMSFTTSPKASSIPDLPPNITSPTGSRTSTNKRKFSLDDDNSPATTAGTGESSASKRRDHNAIEKKYRDNINGKFAELRNCVPSLRPAGQDSHHSKQDLEGLEPAHKFNKATIITKAIEYIRHLEKKQRRFLSEERALRTRIAAFEKLVVNRADGSGKK